MISLFTSDGPRPPQSSQPIAQVEGISSAAKSAIAKSDVVIGLSQQSISASETVSTTLHNRAQRVEQAKSDLEFATGALKITREGTLEAIDKVRQSEDEEFAKAISKQSSMLWIAATCCLVVGVAGVWLSINKGRF